MALRIIIMTRMRRYVMEGDRVFINFTNHPSGGWGEEQMLEAKRYGEVIDLTFPEVDPYGDKKYVTKLAEKYTERLLKMHPAVVLCQGEFCLVYQVVAGLKEKGVKVVAACSERIVEEQDGKKVSVFGFRGFREY